LHIANLPPDTTISTKLFTLTRREKLINRSKWKGNQ